MIRFDNADWQRIRTVYSDFWQHRLQRPVIPITVTGLSPVTSDRTLNPRGLLPPMLQDHSPEQLVAGWDRFLQGCAFIGDA